MSKWNFDWAGLKEKIEKDSNQGGKKSFGPDERFWAPDKKAAGTYIIRFLPDMEGNPYIKLYNHSFKYMVDGVQKWWIGNCVNTFGYDRDCPICKKNMEYWNSSFQSDKDVASARKRKLEYITNILVINDPKNPDNNGKVFLYKFGQKIYDKIKALMFPSEQDLEDPDFISFVPFDLYEGADFKLKVTMQGEFPNYSDSAFSKQKAVGDDKKIEKIMKETHLLNEFIADDKFPTNEETIRVLGDLLGISQATSSNKKAPKKEDLVEEDVAQDDDPPFNVDDISSDETSDDEVDEDAAFFNSLK